VRENRPGREPDVPDWFYARYLGREPAGKIFDPQAGNEFASCCGVNLAFSAGAWRIAGTDLWARAGFSRRHSALKFSEAFAARLKVGPRYKSTGAEEPV
jgi:hypothetical protein